jgi:hypothetical protein
MMTPSAYVESGTAPALGRKRRACPGRPPHPGDCFGGWCPIPLGGRTEKGVPVLGLRNLSRVLR